MRRAGLLAALAIAGCVVATAGGQGPTLSIVFPEGMSVRQMADRVAAVRRIAISQRRITPLLDGKSYAVAARGTTAPKGFAQPASIEGFLFPSLYKFGPST